MKKIRWLPLLLCVLLLAGCGAVRSVQDAINAIGTVSLDSREAIENAEALYGELSPEEQAKVENHALLAQAREEYDRLYRLDQTEKAIDAIGTVSLDSREAIETAETLYGELPQEEQTQIRNYDTLTAAREEYEKLSLVDQTGKAISAAAAAWASDPDYYDMDDYALARNLVFLLKELKTADLYDRLTPEQTAQLQSLSSHICGGALDGYYTVRKTLEGRQELMELYIALPELFPDVEEEVRDDLIYYVWYAYGDLGEMLRENGDYDAAWAAYLQYFSYVDTTWKNSLYYELTDTLEEIIEQPGDDKARIGYYTSALEKADELEAQQPEFLADLWIFRSFRKEMEDGLQALWDQYRPRNGKILSTFAVDSFATFTMSAGDQDACFRISGYTGYCLVYVAANSTVTATIPGGSFTVSCAVGSPFDWVDSDNMFGDSTKYYYFKGLNPSVQGDSGSIIYYHNGQMEAHMVVDGKPNPKLEEITREAFWGEK